MDPVWTCGFPGCGRVNHLERDTHRHYYSSTARGDRRGAAVEPPRQSPFTEVTEVRGKGQQSGVVNISDDDNDDLADSDDPTAQQSDPLDINVPVLQRADDVLDDAAIVRQTHQEVDGVLDGAASVRRAHHGVTNDGAVINNGAVTTQWSGEESKAERMQQVPFQSLESYGGSNTLHALVHQTCQDGY